MIGTPAFARSGAPARRRGAWFQFAAHSDDHARGANGIARATPVKVIRSSRWLRRHGLSIAAYRIVPIADR